MNYRRQLRRIRKELLQQLAYHKQALARFPEGNIEFVKNKYYMKWYFRGESAGAERVPIYRKDRSFAQDLSLKWYHQEMANTLSSLVRVLDTFMTQVSLVQSSSKASLLMQDAAADTAAAQMESIRYANQRVYKERPAFLDGNAAGAENKETDRSLNKAAKPSPINEYRSLVAPFIQTTGSWYTSWLRQPYKRYMRRPEELRIQAKCGLLVRSKSEAIIADLLFEAHIPFHYEECLMVGNTEVYPDFTILIAPDTVVYWEHFGALKRADYLADTQRKMSSYLAGGIYPGRDLYITCEDSDRPLQLQEAEEIMLLISRRYMSSAPFSAEGDAPLRL